MLQSHNMFTILWTVTIVVTLLTAITTKAVIAVTTSKPSTVFNCTFDQNLCGWTQALDDDFDWERSRGRSSGTNTGPGHDHTAGNTDGYYMFTNSKDYMLNQKARLVSPIVNIASNQLKCFQFFYLMHGAEVGTLNVYLSINGTLTGTVWSRTRTQGIFYLRGQVTLNTTAMVIVEGSGSSGNHGDIAIDDVSLRDGPCTSIETPPSVNSLACDFELEDICGYSNAQGNTIEWYRKLGVNSQASYDHTTRTVGGAFMTIGAKSVNQHGSLRSAKVTTQGSYCVSFFYREQGAKIGLLSVSVWDSSLNRSTLLWIDDDATPLDEWNKAQISLNISSAIQLSFDAAMSAEDGDLSIDDISVVYGTCEIPPECSFDKLDLCSWRNDQTHDDDFDWEIATSDSDAQTFAPWRDADNNENGGFILLDMASNPSKGEAYLISDIIVVKGIQCFEFNFLLMTRSSQYEKTPMWLDIYVTIGAEFPGFLVWSYSMTKHATNFALGKLPLQMNQNYRLVIGGYVTLGQVLSLDKFSLTATNCSYLPPEAKPSAPTTSTTTATTKPSRPFTSTRPRSLWDCDFETVSCNWQNLSDSTGNSTWIREQPGFNPNGPHFDHTIGPGGSGYFLILDTFNGKLQTFSPLRPNANYCLIFWYFLYGPSDFEFKVQTMGVSSKTLLYKDTSMGTSWHQMILNVPLDNKPFYIQFNYVQKTLGPRNQLALDDIQVSEGMCSFEVGPSCTFDRGYCNWEGSNDSDFNFTLSPGTASEVIQSDHTTETNMGSFIQAVADGHLEGQKSHLQSTKLTFTDSVCMQFYYFATPLCDSDVSIETLGPHDKHPNPLLDLQDINYGTWQLKEVTIYDPKNTQVIFTVTVGHNKSGAVGFDDVVFFEGECHYIGTTDFENGFDAFHNVYSNDFNWVIASPSNGIFPWLPAKDYSTYSPQGHFAVASFNSTHSSGKKAELWSQLSPQMNSYCTTFYLFVHGSDPGMLTVTLVDYLADTRVVVWSLTPSPGDRDKQINAQFPHVFPTKFYVVFAVTLGSDGGWAIDNIETFPSPFYLCGVRPAQAEASTVAPPTSPLPLINTTSAFSHQSYAECDFEVDLCNWSIPDYSDFRWNRTSGDTGLQFTPTQGRPGGKKFFLTLPNFASGKTAILQSPSFNEQPPGSNTRRQYDFRMWLNIEGEHIGWFTIELDSSTEADTVYLRQTPTNSWEQIEFSVNVSGPFSLSIEAHRGTYDSDSISIDDIEVSDTGDVDDDSVFSCTFESSDLCGFKQDSTDNLDWIWKGGSETQDHTTSSESGHAVVVLQSQGKPGDLARLISRTVPPMSGCMTFWLLMPSDGEALMAYISSGQQEELILQKQNTQGPVWLKCEAPVTSNVPFTIVLEGEVLAQRTSDLAVDDFKLSSRVCDTKGACTFERDTCTWQNSLLNGFDIDWLRGTGNTVGVTGPAIDSTTGSADGYYMYIDSSGPFSYKDKAWLDSETFPQGTRCLHFHYFMSGASVGTLNVYTLVESLNSALVWSLSGDQGSDWKSAMVTVGNDLFNYNVRIEGILGFSVTSDIAIDDIMFMPDACDTQPSEAQIVSILSTTTKTLVTNPNSPTILEKCDFNDVSLCGFKNGTSDYSWLMSGPNMPASDTLKPFNGHTSNSSNTFIYAQVGNNLGENATARIISPRYTFNQGEPKCLEFYYHMNGDQVGQLNVYIAPDGQENSPTKDMRLWSQNFDAGPGWKVAHVPILQATNYHVIFEAIRSKFDYYYGVDDLKIFDNECEPSESCDFEDDLCLWSNEGAEPDSKLYWRRYHGQERTARFAPAVDHTSQTVAGYYMLVESSLSDTGSVARLYSQAFAGSNSPYCFHFWYYMFGDQLGQLKVYVRNSISSISFYSNADLWELDGPTDNDWHLAQVNISQAYTKKPFMVIIEATVGSALEGAFGIDDTQFEMSECETQPSAAIVTADALMLPDCDFDNGDTCDWTSVHDEIFQFNVSNNGGDISSDHSGGAGEFLLADSKKLPQNAPVFLQSPLLPPTLGTSCLTLWYNMKVSSMSDLSLILISGGSDVPLWVAAPEQSNEWLSASINIQINFDYQLLLKATVGMTDGGSVAVDDIALIHGACPRSGKINFEDGLSGFARTDASNIKWLPVLANDTFAQTDHTYGTNLGHVLQADLGSTQATLKTAEVQSPLYPSAGDECLEFWYTKRGSSGGWLSVQITGSGPGFVNEDSAPLWVTTTATNGSWKRALVDIFSEYPYWITFRAAANNTQVNDIIAIDDISFGPDACPSPVTCDFDLNTCNYASPFNGSIWWRTVKGMYSDSLMPFDQTLQSDQGTYAEVDFKNIQSTYSVDLISPIEKQIFNKCLSFWYYGSGEGTLQVFVQTNIIQRNLLVAKTVTTVSNETRLYRSWKNVQVDVNSSAPYAIVFEANSQKPDTSFAIDSIELVNSTCANLTNKPNTHPSASSLLDPKTALFGCDFENSSFCNFTTGNRGTFGWKIFFFDSKHSPGTGVNYDHTKFNKYGHHVYMDASGQKFNATAQLISPIFVNDKFVCLSFYYAMYGRDVNRLNVYVSQGQADLYWTRSGNQGKGWHHQLVEIGESPQPTQVIFEGVVGSSNEGDIDLDDIWIFDGRCPPPDVCDFEDSEMCKMDQDNLDDADWSIQLADQATGADPKTDHTYGTGEGHYLLVDMSKTQSSDEARIFTQQYTAGAVRCLSFWFHFTNPPSNSHTLTVTLQDERGIGTPLIVLRGFFKENWNPAYFSLQQTENFQIVFDGQSSGPAGSIALDDISVSPDECQSYIDCDFESHDMCGWEPVPEYSTPPWEVIPPNHYMTLNFSDLPNSGYQVSKVQSLIIPAGFQNDFCFTFNYMMYGGNVGFLNISIEVEYPEPQSVIIFTIYGDQGEDTWRYAYGNNPQIDLGISRFVITGTTATSNSTTETAVILMSDIMVVLQSCSDWLRQKEAFFTCRADYVVPISSVCDFLPDCIADNDEENCGTCNFEDDYCKWENDGIGTMTFTAVSSIPNRVFTDSHPGKFLTLQRSVGSPGGYADLVLDQELGPSPYNCSLIFSYYMSLNSQSRYGNLYVSIEENNEETVVWESSQSTSSNWQTASVDIGSIHTRFKLHFSVQYLPFDNAIGIDDIKFGECSFADTQSGTCATPYTCARSGACIDSSTKLCDFTDECGDSSDENPSICDEYLMDNFEDSFGDWSQDNQDDFDWSRHSGRWISSSSGPRRDHTLGTHFGHYLIFEGGTHSDGQIARLISPKFLPTQNSDCKIRFYYHMHGSNKGQLTLYIRSTTSGKMQQIGQYFTTLIDSWLFGSGTLSSGDIFQVIFEGKVVGQHSTDIGLDDVTFTPQCQLKNPSTNRPGTTGNNGGVTTKSGSTGQPRSTAKTGFTVRSGSTSKPSTVTVPTGKQPTKAAMAASTSSDSWKVPVGVVLGLLILVAVIIGTFIYLKRTRRISWVTFPLLRTKVDDVNPIFQSETTEDIPIPMTNREEISGESSEQNKIRDSHGAISNPLYADTSQPPKCSSDV